MIKTFLPNAEYVLSDIFDTIKTSEVVIEDCRQGLISLRGKEWRKGIDNDDRHSVKILCKSIQRHKEYIDELLANKVVIQPQPSQINFSATTLNEYDIKE
jgi:hypothetical protein